jgi:uncharacterized protein YfkK (UPF0435 family)
MLFDRKHNQLINEIISKAIRIKLDIYDSALQGFAFSEQNYDDLREIKNMVTELEKMKTQGG